MKKSCYSLFCLFFLLLFANYIDSRAESGSSSLQRQKAFEDALGLMKAFKNDSANIIFSHLIQELESIDSLNTPFGLAVQLRQAEAIEKDHQDEEAIQKLLHVVEVSTEYQKWDVLSNAYLSLARLHEKLDRQEKCKQYLEQVRIIINLHEVDSLYPRFAIRSASYFRLFDDRDSARYFADEALRTAPKYNIGDEEAVAHLLVGMLVPKDSVDKIVYHYTSAGKVWKATGDFSGYGAVMGNLSFLFFKHDKLNLALTYNDSCLIALSKAQEAGHENKGWLGAVYQRRGHIFKAMGQLDSAIANIEKGYELETAYAYNLESEKVAEIEAKYDDEKKAQQIKDQAQQLKYQKQSRNWLIALFGLSLVFAGVLVNYLLRLRSANKKTKEQTLVIAKTNEELSQALEQQIILQGEVHHRVKNNLQVLISLLELQSEEIQDVKALESLEAMGNRIYSIAAIHEILYQDQGAELVDLLEYTRNLCSHFSLFMEKSNAPVFQLNIDKRLFNLQTLMPLGIILNELLTNSIKYASDIGNRLIIGIDLHPLSDGFCLSYRDNGPGFPKGILEEREGGLGTYLLKSMSRQLNGHLESMNDNGAVFKIFFKEKKSNLNIGFIPFFHQWRRQ